MSSQHSGWASLELRKLEDLTSLVVLALMPASPSLPSLRQGFPRFTTPFLRPEGLWSVTTYSGSCVQSHSHSVLQMGPQSLTVEMHRHPASSQLPQTSSSRWADKASLAKKVIPGRSAATARGLLQKMNVGKVLGKWTPGPPGALEGRQQVPALL